MVPLTHLVPPEQQRGGQRSYDEKVASILTDVTHGIIPSWVTSHVDVALKSRVIDVPSCPLCGSDLNLLPAGVLACSGCEHVQEAK